MKKKQKREKTKNSKVRISSIVLSSPTRCIIGEILWATMKTSLTESRLLLMNLKIRTASSKVQRIDFAKEAIFVRDLGTVKFRKQLGGCIGVE